MPSSSPLDDDFEKFMNERLSDDSSDEDVKPKPKTSSMAFKSSLSLSAKRSTKKDPITTTTTTTTRSIHADSPGNNTLKSSYSSICNTGTLRPPDMTEDRLDTLLSDDSNEDDDKERFYKTLESQAEKQIDYSDSSLSFDKMDEFEDYDLSDSAQSDLKSSTKTIELSAKSIDLKPTPVVKSSQIHSSQTVDASAKLVDQYKKKVQELEDTIDELKRVHRNEIEQLHQEKSELDIKLSSAEFKEREARIEVSRLRSDKEDLETELKKAKAETKKDPKDQQMLLQLQSEISDFKNQVQALEDENEKLLKEVTEANTELMKRKLDKKDTESQKTISKLENEIEQLKRQIKSIQFENEILTSRLNDQAVLSQSRERQPKATLDDKEIEALRKDLADQEKILQATNEHNKMLINQLKSAEKELKELKNAPTLRNVTLNSVESRQDVSLLREKVYELEIQLHHQQEMAHERETELKAELQKAKQGRRDLEESTRGISKMQDDRKLLEALEAKLQLMELKHHSQVDELTQKLQWFEENQAGIERDEQTIFEQEQTIRFLRKRIGELETQNEQYVNKPLIGNTTKRQIRGPSPEQKRIGELEKEVEDLKKKLSAKAKEKIQQPVVSEEEFNQLKKENGKLKAQVEALQDTRSKWVKQENKSENNQQQEMLKLRREVEELKIKLDVANLGKDTVLDSARDMVKTANTQVATLKQSHEEELTKQQERHRSEIQTVKMQYENQLEFYRNLLDQSEKKYQDQVYKNNYPPVIQESAKPTMNNEIEAELEGKEQDEEEVENARRLRQLRYLLNKIEEIESKHRLREMEFARTLHETKFKAEVELSMAKHQFELALQDKNREVQKFKIQLENIRSALEEMKRQNAPTVQRRGPAMPNSAISPKLVPPKPHPQPEKLFHSRFQ